MVLVGVVCSGNRRGRCCCLVLKGKPTEDDFMKSMMRKNEIDEKDFGLVFFWVICFGMKAERGDRERSHFVESAAAVEQGAQ